MRKGVVLMNCPHCGRRINRRSYNEWSAEELRQLAVYKWLNLSPRDIAELMPERTRNSIIGKLDRLNGGLRCSS